MREKVAENTEIVGLSVNIANLLPRLWISALMVDG